MRLAVVDGNVLTLLEKRYENMDALRKDMRDNIGDFAEDEWYTLVSERPLLHVCRRTTFSIDETKPSAGDTPDTQEAK